MSLLQQLKEPYLISCLEHLASSRRMVENGLDEQQVGLEAEGAEHLPTLLGQLVAAHHLDHGGVARVVRVQLLALTEPQLSQPLPLLHSAPIQPQIRTTTQRSLLA